MPGTGSFAGSWYDARGWRASRGRCACRPRRCLSLRQRPSSGAWGAPRRGSAGSRRIKRSGGCFFFGWTSRSDRAELPAASVPGERGSAAYPTWRLTLRVTSHCTGSALIASNRYGSTTCGCSGILARHSHRRAEERGPGNEPNTQQHPDEPDPGSRELPIHLRAGSRGCSSRS